MSSEHFPEPPERVSRQTHTPKYEGAIRIRLDRIQQSHRLEEDPK